MPLRPFSVRSLVRTTPRLRLQPIAADDTEALWPSVSEQIPAAKFRR